MMLENGERWRVVEGDALAVLAGLSDASIDAIVTDPPYAEVDRDYGRLTEAEWHTLMRGVVAECRRVLKPSGSAVFVLQPNSERVGRMRPWLWEFMAWTAREWNMVQDAWWWNPNALPSGGSTEFGLLRPSLKVCVWLGPPDCYREQAAVLWQETERNKAMRQVARAERKSPSGRRVVNTRMGDAAAGRGGGVTPFNVLPIMGSDRWDSGGALGHSASTPLPLCDWWVRYLCPPGGTVLDPFNGSGTVGIAALRHGCRYVGIEQRADYCTIARRRLAAAAAQPSLFAPAEAHESAPAPVQELMPL